MKVLHIIVSMNPSSGGPCQGIRNSIPVLEKHDIYREVVSLDGPDDFLGKDDFLIHALGPGKGPWSYNKKLEKWLEENMGRFDAIIVNGLWQYHGYAARKAYKRIQQKGDGPLPKFFVMPHGMLDPYFQRAAHRKLKAIRNWFYWKLIESKVVNNANALLFTCETELLLARETFSPYHPKQERNVGYGVAEPPVYTDAMRAAFLLKCPHLTGKSYFLFISRIHDKKGVDLLIQAYNEVYGNEAQAPALVIAGPGVETAYGKKMEQLVNNSSRLKTLVCFPGMLSGDAKWGAFYGCEAFVLPSHQENFGIAVAESLSCGKPVLISNQVNIWREIAACEGGIVEDDTLEGTTQLLEKWKQLDNEKKKWMEKQARGCYQKYFSVAEAAVAMIHALRG